MQFSYPITDNIAVAFVTPVLVAKVGEHEQLNPPLKAQVLDAMGKDEGAHISNRDGW
jgi:hypothetical protein